MDKVNPDIADKMRSVTNQKTKIAVIIRLSRSHTEDDKRRLMECGLEIKVISGSVASGSIAVGDLEKLVVLDFVLRIEAPLKLYHLAH